MSLTTKHLGPTFLRIGHLLQRIYHQWDNTLKAATCRSSPLPCEEQKPLPRFREKRGDRVRCSWEPDSWSLFLDDVWVKEHGLYDEVQHEMREYFDNPSALSSIATVAQVLLSAQSDRVKHFTTELLDLLPQGFDIKPFAVPLALPCIQVSFPDGTSAYRTTLGLPNRSDEIVKASISQLLATALAHSEVEEVITTLRGCDAQRALNSLQEDLDAYRTGNRDLIKDERDFDTVARLLVELSRKSNMHPRNLYLADILNLSNQLARYGKHSDVFDGTREGRKVAIKRFRIIPPSTQADRTRTEKTLICEVLRWRQLRHPNIVPIEGLFQTPCETALNIGWVVMPWLENGDIVEHMKTLHPGPSEERLNRWLSEVAQGLHYLHTKHIIHGDIRGSNVLIDDEGNARLTDYGIMPNADFGSISYMEARSNYTMAPEMLNPKEISPEFGRPTYAGDIYAFAFLCVEVYTSKAPMGKMTPDLELKIAVEGERPNRPVTPSGISMGDSLWSVVNECWVHEPEDRPDSMRLTQLMFAL